MIPKSNGITLKKTALRRFLVSIIIENMISEVAIMVVLMKMNCCMIFTFLLWKMLRPRVGLILSEVRKQVEY